MTDQEIYSAELLFCKLWKDLTGKTLNPSREVEETESDTVLVWENTPAMDQSVEEYENSNYYAKLDYLTTLRDKEMQLSENCVDFQESEMHLVKVDRINKKLHDLLNK